MKRGLINFKWDTLLKLYDIVSRTAKLLLPPDTLRHGRTVKCLWMWTTTSASDFKIKQPYASNGG